jgi:hypothetical protein
MKISKFHPYLKPQDYAGVNPTIQWLQLPGIAKVSLSGIPSLSVLLLYDDLLLISLLFMILSP